jgi:hypothetical protein
MPRGGARTGAGRKPATVLPMPGVQAPPGPVPEPPADMTTAETAVWREWAPAATENGTLYPATMLGFRHMCELIVRQRAMGLVIDAEGWQQETTRVDGAGQEHIERKPHPLHVTHLKLVQRVEHALRCYGLLGNGKPAPRQAVEAPPADPWTERARRKA